jgi:hypothetical protein
MDISSIILAGVIVYVVIRFLGLDKKDNFEPFENPTDKEKKLKEKLYDEIQKKQWEIKKKLTVDYKKWESTIDLKKKEKIWSQLSVQQELWDKLDKLYSADSDFVEKAKLYLEKAKLYLKDK